MGLMWVIDFAHLGWIGVVSSSPPRWSLFAITLLAQPKANYKSTSGAPIR